LHFNRFVKSTDQFYTAKKDWFSLNNFYVHIENSGLLSSAHRLRYAKALFLIGNQLAAIEKLEGLKDDANFGEQATAALNTLRGTSPNTTKTASWQRSNSVALRKAGNQFLININLNRYDDVTLLIDTGASITTLSKDAFLALNSQRDAVKLGNRLFQTANGTNKGTVYSMPQLTIGSYQLQNVKVAVLDFSLSQGIHGLLGMNVLGQFRFQIDQDQGRLLLDKK